jgi:demethylmenaquinone methyltransferase / 2-methoxy-6-polyprenyl-1,4-benzoquinol methylase
MSAARPAEAPGGPDKRPDRIAGMFDAIAPRYDLLNRLLSVGIDRVWRARLIRELQFTGRELLLDVCTGTADVALEARRGVTSAAGTTDPVKAGAARVIGVDFSGAMLRLGLDKVRAAGETGRIRLVRGDAMRLPVATASADAASVAFGIRNVERADAACAEIARCLRAGGRLAILEFGIPNVPGLRPLYLWYFRTVLPRIGRLISGHTGAYSYLPASVGAFPPPETFAGTLREAGFTSIRAIPLTGGIVYLYVAVRG